LTASETRPLPGGIWGFPVSTFSGDGELDAGAFAAGVRHQVDGGVSAVVVNGALAEADTLDTREWRIAAETALAVVDGRVPVVAALPAPEDSARAAARLAGELGVAAMLVLPPRDDPAALLAHARGAADLASLPVVLYQRGRVRLSADALEPAVRDRTVIGVKDGTRDLRAFRRLLDELGDGIVSAAAFEDMSLPYWGLGVDALCPASVAHDPAYALAWHSLLASGEIEAARGLLRAFAYPFTDLRLSRPGIDVAVVKEAMALRGLRAGGARAPGQPLSEPERAQVRGLLRRLDAAMARVVEPPAIRQ
jgi:dihydrodipicolinate synthase/N-acetylneuraminate lyase